MHKKSKKHNDLTKENATHKKHKSPKREDYLHNNPINEDKNTVLVQKDIDTKHSHKNRKNEESKNSQVKSKHHSADKDKSKREKSHSPAVITHRHESAKRKIKERGEIIDTSRRRHHSSKSADNKIKSIIKNEEPLHKSSTHLSTKHSPKYADGKEKTPKHRSKSERKSKELNKDNISQIWYCQVETDNPFKKNKTNNDKNDNKKHKKHKSLKDTATSHGRSGSSEKQVFDTLSPNIHKSKIHHFKDPTFSTLLKPNKEKNTDLTEIKPRSKSRKKSKSPEQKINKKNHATRKETTTSIEVEQKIEDSLKVYFNKIQNMIDRKLEAIIPVKEDIERKKPKHNKIIDKTVEMNNNEISLQKDRNLYHDKTEKKSVSNEIIKSKENIFVTLPTIMKTHHPQCKHYTDADQLQTKTKNIYEDTNKDIKIQANLKKEKLDRQTTTVRNRSCSIHRAASKDHFDYSGIIRDVIKGNVISNPSTSVMYVKTPENKNINKKNREKESHYWVEGVEPAKRDVIPKSRRRKLPPTLQSKIVSIIGIPSQPVQSYKYYDNMVMPLEDVLKKKKKLKRFKLYYQYLKEKNNSTSETDSTRISIPSDSCKILSDQSDPKDYIPLTRKPPQPISVDNYSFNSHLHENVDVSYGNIKLNDYHFFLRENNREKVIFLTNNPDSIIDKIEKPNKDFNKSQKRQVQRKIKKQIEVKNVRSDTDISYYSLNNKNLNPKEAKSNTKEIASTSNKKVEDDGHKELNENFNQFKQSLEKQTPDTYFNNTQLIEFLQNMHQLYIKSQEKVDKKEDIQKAIEIKQTPKKSSTEQTLIEKREIETNTDDIYWQNQKPEPDLSVNRSVETCNDLNIKVDRMTSYKKFDEFHQHKETNTPKIKIYDESQRREVSTQKNIEPTRKINYFDNNIPMFIQQNTNPIIEYKKVNYSATSTEEFTKCNNSIDDLIRVPEKRQKIISKSIDKASTSINKPSFDKATTSINKPSFTKFISKPFTREIIEQPLIVTKPRKIQHNEATQSTGLLHGIQDKQKEDDIKKKKKRPVSATTPQKVVEEDYNFPIKKSRSEINFDKKDLEKQESKITSLVNLETFQNTSPSSDTSQTKAQSLDRYLITNKSVTNTRNYNSRLLVTKNFRNSDSNSYERRKKYDAVMRKKMKRKLSLQEKQLSQIFEVRYLTLGNTFVKPDTLERIPESEECFNKIKKDTLIKGKFNKIIESIKNDPNTPYIQVIEFLNQLPEFFDPDSFNLKNKCKHCDTGKNFLNFVNYLCSSLKSRCGSIKTKDDFIKDTKTVNKLYSVKDNDTVSSINDMDDDYQLLINQSVPKGQKSCPILRASDPSFDFLYQEESDETIWDTKKVMNPILGFSLNHEINRPNIESPRSETSGYASSKSKQSFSISNFFKKPKVAALLKPQIGETNQESVNYSQKEDSKNQLKSSESESNIYDVSFSQSLPSNSIHDTTIFKKFASDTNLLHYKLFFEPYSKRSSNQIPQSNYSDTLLLYEKDSTLEKIINSDLFLTNLSSCSITLLESYESIDNSNKLKEKHGSAPEIKRIIAKKFFENILEMYENEMSISSALYDDEYFIEEELIAKVKRLNKKIKSKHSQCGFKVVCRKLFNRKRKLVAEETTLEQNPEKTEPVENEYQKKLQALAYGARKYFTSLVEAVAINNKMYDELKIYGILRLLAAIEQGHFIFLRKFVSHREKADVEQEIKNQVRQTFTDVYSIAKCEADKSRRKLTNNDLKLMSAFVCKYRIGLLSKTDIVASYLGKGFFENEIQLKAAVIFLLKTSHDVNFNEFEDNCLKYVTSC